MKTVLLLAALLALGLGGYLYLNPDVANHWLLGERSNAPTTTRVYKWQDARGNWQITDQPPPEGIPFETRDYHHDVNVLPLPPALQPKD